MRTKTMNTLTKSITPSAKIAIIDSLVDQFNQCSRKDRWYINLAIECCIEAYNQDKLTKDCLFKSYGKNGKLLVTFPKQSTYRGAA